VVFISIVYILYTLIVLTVVPLRLNDDEVRKLNMLMRQGKYKSRNEAIRAILANGLEEALGDDEDVTELVNLLLAINKKGKSPVSYRLKRSIVDIVSEGRK